MILKGLLTLCMSIVKSHRPIFLSSDDKNSPKFDFFVFNFVIAHFLTHFALTISFCHSKWWKFVYNHAPIETCDVWGSFLVFFLIRNMYTFIKSPTHLAPHMVYILYELTDSCTSIQEIYSTVVLLTATDIPCLIAMTVATLTTFVLPSKHALNFGYLKA